MYTSWTNVIILYFWILFCNDADCIFVDKGNPYADGPQDVGELTFTITIDNSPKHTQVYFPLGTGEFGVVYFLGGLDGYVPVELYSIIMTKIAKHGFFVVGVDYAYPGIKQSKGDLKQDIDVSFKEIEFLQQYMVNRTIGVPQWNRTGLLCHSAGCEDTVRMIAMNKFPFKSSVFLEPFSQYAHGQSKMNLTVPSLMYATKEAYDGLIPCNMKGYDFQQIYNIWKCPRMSIKLAEYGHCDILDPFGWHACHLGKICKTTNSTILDGYRQMLQGIVASFFITTLQGRPDAIQYIQDVNKIPVKTSQHQIDWNC